MRLVIVTALWGRPELTKVFLKHIRSITRGKDVELLAVGSEGSTSLAACQAEGWNYIERPNTPLSQKFNAVFEKAADFKPDGVMLMGSDDLPEERLIDSYLRDLDHNDMAITGLRDLYFYSALTGKAIHYKGFIGNKSKYTIGCGRLFPRKVLDRLRWRPWGDEKINRGLDLCCSRRLLSMNIGEKQRQMADVGAAVDIKTGQNITEMKTFLFNFAPVEPEMLFKMLPGPFEEIAKLAPTWRT